MIAWIVCTALVCVHSLAAWILYLRSRPKVTRAEYDAMVESVKALRGKVEKAQAALTMRGLWGP